MHRLAQITRGKVRCFLLAGIAAAALLPSTGAEAAGPNAVRGLSGCTANSLPANDDGSTALVATGLTGDFYGQPIDHLYVNNNGNVTFGEALGDYTPYDFTTTGQEIIAPFLADVDTRTGATTTYGTTTVGGHSAFCVNWVDVGYFSQHTDKTNSFQLLLIDAGSGNFDIEFNYDRISWETGDASSGSGGLGGTSATIGYANGDGDPSHFFVRDGSFENGALLDGASKSLTGGSFSIGGQLGRYVFHVVNAAPTGATLTGEVDDPDAGDPVAGAPVEICPTGSGPCVARFTNTNGIYRAVNLPAGAYEVTAHSAPGGPEYADGAAGPVSVSGTTTFTQDVTLGPELGGPPPGTTLSNIGESSGGVPTLYWEDSSTLVTDGCANGTATWSITGLDSPHSGPMTETPAGSGHYVATIPPLAPDHGDAQVHIVITGAGCSNVDFGAYIDPSGRVRTTSGAPIAGATVVLLRSSDSDGPFIQVPDGSAIMSPGNRTNPDSTDSSGRFAWDVIAGFYKVRASAPGCGTTSTDVLEIPPPVTDIDLRLSCASSGGGGGAAAAAASVPKKKCKKKKAKKATAAKACKKKKAKKSAARSLGWAAMQSTGTLFAGAPEPK